jgi:hypothetical protein
MALSLPQISLLPNLQGLLAGALQAVGGSTILDLYNRVDGIVKNPASFSVPTVQAILGDVKTLVASAENLFGAPIPGSLFANIANEVTKYEAIATAILSGQPELFSTIDVAGPNGEELIVTSYAQLKSAVAPAVHVA